jgi:hypothetical protein
VTETVAGTTPEGGAVKTGYLELNENERKMVDVVAEKTKSFLVSGFKEEIAKAREAWEKEVVPGTRPTFGPEGAVAGAEPSADRIKRFGAAKRAVIDRSSGKAIAFRDAIVDRTAELSKLNPGEALAGIEGGFLPPIQMSPGDRAALAEDFGAYVDDLSKSEKKGNGVSFNVLKFPRGDIENFSVCRWAMALERSQNTAEGTQAFAKHAPWESAYYAALESYGETKAQGDMVSGQDGGYIAPELWSTNFVDQIYPQAATSRLPITRIPMGNRVVHVPRLSANIQVNYGAENAALTANQAQFQQISFTARKQYAFIQISNELIRDSNPAAQTILQNNAARYMALDMDYQILLGNGLAGTPTGLYNQTNVTKANGSNGGGFSGAAAPAGVGSNSKYPRIDDLTNSIFNVEDLNNSANVPIGQANVTGVVGAVALKTLITGANDAALSITNGTTRPDYDFGYNQMRWANRPDGSSSLDGFLGIPTWVLTNVVKHSLLAGSGGASAAPTSNASRLASPNPVAVADMNPVFFGDWQHLWVMQRMDIEILASNVAGTAFQNDQTWVRLIRRYDVGVAHPEPFYIVTNG